MKKKISIITGFLICLVVIVVSYLWATALMDSMYAYQSPLHETPPTPGEISGEANTRSVVIVLVDALRYDTSMKVEVMPFLNELRSIGASARMNSRPPTYSQPAYTVILTGAWPDLSDGPAMNLDYADIPIFTQDDIFSAAKRAGLDTAISGFNWFEKLIPQYAVDASFYTAGEDQAADRQVTDAAVPWLKQGKYRLVLIHLDQVDYAGHHEGGPQNPNWDEAASRVDGLISEIISAMDLAQDTLLVISDHGQIDPGGHGGQDAVTLLEPFVMVGNGVVPGDYGDIKMVDIAPTVAAILGTNIPATSQGTPLFAVYDFEPSQVEKIQTVLSSQQSQLAEAYGSAIGEPVNVEATSNIVDATQQGMEAARLRRLNSERVIRGLVGVFLIILFLSLATWHAKPYIGLTWLGVLIYLVVFNFKYIFIDQKTFSLSSVSDAMSLITSTALTTLIALVIGWIFVFLMTRAYGENSGSAADITMKYILVSLSLLSVPIIIHYVINGAVVTWTLPSFLVSFLGLLFLIQTMVVALVGMILVAISALIGKLVNKKVAITES